MTEDNDISMPANEEAPAGQSHVDYAARRLERASQKKADSRRHLWWYGAAAVVGILVLLIAAEAIVSAGRVHPGVTAAAVPVGGMSKVQAKAALEHELSARASASPVTITYEKDSWPVQAADVALDFDYDAMVDDAYAVGREGGVLPATGARFKAWFGGIDIAAAPAADAARVEAVLNKVAAKTDVAPQDATVKMEGTEPKVVDGADGLALDRPVATAKLLSAFSSDKRTVAAPVSPVAHEVTAAEAKKAAEVAALMVSAPVTVNYDTKSWKFAPEQVAKWVAFGRSDATKTAEISSVASATADGNVTLVAYVSADSAEKAIAPALGTGIGRPAKDARFKTASGGVTIIPSQDGIGPDMESLAVSLTSELASESSSRSVELRTRRTEPQLTTEEARNMGVKERISTFTTTYDGGNAPRVNNVHLLGDALDGKLIAPGDTFSFNGAVGERTAAKGYKEANAIVNGKLVPQLGGGICQVGTTLFNAIYESGLPVVQRKNHSFYISHYPDGRDATVSWGGPDLKFKNDTANWVLISVSYTGSSITISLYGTDPGYEVTTEKGPWTNVTPFPTEEIKDPTLPVGVKVVEDSGVNGRSIVVKRIVKKGGTVIRTDEFTSKYKPKVQVVRVGTKPKASKSTTSTPKP